MHNSMASKDTDSFWRSWRSLYSKKSGTNNATVINGLSSENGIADSFKNHFSTVSQLDNIEKVNDLNHRFANEYELVCHNHVCNCKSYEVDMNIMMDAIFSLNEGKSKDADEISSEHFLYAPVSLVSRLVDLTNHMLRHSYVPNQFKLGVILPLVKDTGGDKTDLQSHQFSLRFLSM